ncbi:TetR family transcriptional regulator [Mycobacterium sp. E2479]|uniref:TetR family transcriptional regulator n=1 Tax=Mycobacterium sp. E2479 TaxID=1834134 RepID=UPI000ACC866C
MVIDETVRCVLEEGAAAASAKHITERAGVTWGVVQYHFGDRDGLLMAVVDQGFSQLLDTLRGVDPNVVETTGRRRTAMLLDAVWAAFSSSTSVAALEILVATRSGRSLLEQKHLTELLSELTHLGRYIGDSLDRRRADAIGELIWTALLGSILAQMVVGRTVDTSRQRRALLDTITAYIAQHESSPGPRRRRRRPVS